MNNLIQFINEASVETILLSVTIAMLSLNVLLVLLRKKSSKQTEVVQSLQRDLRALTSAALGMGGRVMEIERQQRINNKKQDKVQTIKPVSAPVQPVQQVQQVQSIQPVQPVTSSSQYYDHAIRMAQQGAKTEDIEQACGLSKSEAELISIMHRLDKAG